MAYNSNTYLLFLMASVGQVFCGLLGRFWLRDFHEAVVRCWLGLQAFEGLTEAGGSTYKVAPSHDWPFGAGCGLEASLPLYMGLSMRLLEYPHGIVADFYQSE